MSIIQSARGFTLPELVIGLGLVGGLSLVTMNLVKDQTQNENYLKTKAEISKTISVLESALANGEKCKEMLVGKSVGGHIPSLQVTVRDGVKVFLAENTKYSEFEIRSGGIKLLHDAELGADSNIKAVEISFFAKKKFDQIFEQGSQEGEIKQRIRIALDLNGSVVRDCGPVIGDSNLDAAQKMCLSLGPDAAFWNGSQCVLKTFKCPWGQVPAEVQSFGAIKCVPLKDQINMSDLFDTSGQNCVGKAAYSLYVGNSGKVAIRCN